MTVPAPVAAWHEVVDRRDPALIGPLLADDVVFRSPAVHTPQEGRAVTVAYLRAALVVLGPGLQYHRELYGDDSAMLEFTTTVGGKEVHGIDLLRWGTDGLLTEFTVMVRPAQAMAVVIEHMGAELQRGQ